MSYVCPGPGRRPRPHPVAALLAGLSNAPEITFRDVREAKEFKKTTTTRSSRGADGLRTTAAGARRFPLPTDHRVAPSPPPPQAT
eukprot:scaffold12213_cov115-Isochrysis_galbana.AAC.9